MTSNDSNGNTKLDVDLSATLEHHAKLNKYRNDQSVPLLQADVLNDCGLQHFYNQVSPVTTVSLSIIFNYFTHQISCFS